MNTNTQENQLSDNYLEVLEMLLLAKRDALFRLTMAQADESGKLRVVAILNASRLAEKKSLLDLDLLMLSDPSDHFLTAGGLDRKYNQSGDGQHPNYTRIFWRVAVEKQLTDCGYWEWVHASLHVDD